MSAAGGPLPAIAGGALPPIAGGSPELEAAGEAQALGAGCGSQPEVVLVALLAGAATLFFGIIPGPLFDLVQKASGAASGSSRPARSPRRPLRLRRAGAR